MSLSLPQPLLILFLLLPLILSNHAQLFLPWQMLTTMALFLSSPLVPAKNQQNRFQDESGVTHWLTGTELRKCWIALNGMLSYQMMSTCAGPPGGTIFYK